MKNSNSLIAFSTYLSIVLVAILLAFNYKLFIIENNFAPAGLNGITTMIQYKTGFSIGYMSLIINVPLCVFAYFLSTKNSLSVVLPSVLLIPLFFCIYKKSIFPNSSTMRRDTIPSSLYCSAV